MSDVNFSSKEHGGFIENWLLDKTSGNDINDDRKYSGWREICAPNGELKADLSNTGGFCLGVYIYTPAERILNKKELSGYKSVLLKPSSRPASLFPFPTMNTNRSTCPS